MRSILEFGAKNDGSADLSAVFAEAFAAGEREILIPAGEYRLDHTLRIPSNAKIVAEDGAHIFANPGNYTDAAMIENENQLIGDENITVTGGLWDGRCDLNDRDSYCDIVKIGLMFNFVKATNLVLENLRVINGVSYHFRLGECRHFRVENIRIEGTIIPLCQDGIHMGGGCEYGLIKNIWVVDGGLGDDLIALNADDAFWFGQNIGMKPLPIRHIRVENVDACNCYTVIRLLSLDTEISDVYMKNIRGGYRAHGINMDAGHLSGGKFYFHPSKHFCKAGAIRDVTFEDISLWCTAPVEKRPGRPCIAFEENVKNMRFVNLSHPRENETQTVPMFRFNQISETDFTVDGVTRHIAHGETYEHDQDHYGEILINSDTELLK